MKCPNEVTDGNYFAFRLDEQGIVSLNEKWLNKKFVYLHNLSNHTLV